MSEESEAKQPDEAIDIIGAQIGAFAATHQDLGALIRALLIVEQKKMDHDIAAPLSDRALDLSHAMLRKMIEHLEDLRQKRRL